MNETSYGSSVKETNITEQGELKITLKTHGCIFLRIPPPGLGGGEGKFFILFHTFPQNIIIFPNLEKKTLTSRGKNFSQRGEKRTFLKKIYTPI